LEISGSRPIAGCEFVATFTGLRIKPISEPGNLSLKPTKEIAELTRSSERKGTKGFAFDFELSTAQ